MFFCSKRAAFVLVVFLAGAGGLAAQQAPYVEYEGQLHLVQNVEHGNPCIRKGDKVVPVRSPKSALVDVEEFMPFFVSVRNINVSTHYVHMSGTGGSGDVNHDFNFTAEFESPFFLPDVFIVLELNSEEAGKRMFFHGIGDLEPRKLKHVSTYVPMRDRLGEGNYRLHLFSRGRELLHSHQPPLFRDHVLDRMVLSRVKNTPDAPLKPFVGPGPEYPAALFKQHAAGRAVVQFRVTRTGAVLDPVLLSATHPAFGESAVAAIRLWRFLPKMQGGRPVEATAEMPFEFTPPADAK